MNTVCAGGDGDINSVVDEHTCARATDGLDSLCHQCQESAVWHIPFANLYQMDPRSGR